MLNKTAKKIIESIIYRKNNEEIIFGEYGISNFQFCMSEGNNYYFSAMVSFKKVPMSVDDTALLILKSNNDNQKNEFVLVLSHDDMEYWNNSLDYETMIKKYGNFVPEFKNSDK